MIVVRGDIHGDPRDLPGKFEDYYKDMTKDDVVIICGDFGLIWDWVEESPKEKYWLDWLEGKNYTTVFVDGNHENFDRLYQYPIKEWNGGLVHEIRPSILHLIRGEVYEIQGKKLFAFGGATSHDIKDGILDPEKDKQKIKEWKYDYTKMFRVLGRSWWPQEIATKEEMQHGLNNLSKHGNKVDFVITHCCPTSTQTLLSHGWYKADAMTDYLETVRQNIEFDKWYFGHYHADKGVNSKEIAIYEMMTRIV